MVVHVVPGRLEAFVFLDAAPKPRSSKLQEQFNFETFVPEVIIEQPGEFLFSMGFSLGLETNNRQQECRG